MMELRPIVVRLNTVISGNMRLAALKAMGLNEIPDSWVVDASELTRQQAEKILITDNVNFGEWDYGALINYIAKDKDKIGSWINEEVPLFSEEDIAAKFPEELPTEPPEFYRFIFKVHQDDLKVLDVFDEDIDGVSKYRARGISIIKAIKEITP